MKEKNDLKKALFHDIKNKLLTIKFNIYLILKKPLDEEKKEELLNKVLLTTDQVLDIVQDILDYEKYKSKKFKKYSTFNLIELVDEIIDELELDAQRKNIKILFVKPKEVLNIKANKEWLKKALFNILHNSIKYNRNNGRVIINFHIEKNGYILIIKDTGKGISIEEREKIFKKYYSTDQKTGTGIGLNLAKTIIENLGGTIIVKSEKERGSAFYIYLPKTPKKKFNLLFLK
jgi:signal transduction histidine kinase